MPRASRQPKKGDVYGFDAGKKVKGRKRHLLVDTLGLILKALVHSASVQDRDGAKRVLQGIRYHHRLLQRVWADGAYRGELIAWVKRLTGIELEIVKRNDDIHTFQVVPKRWVSERTFAWLNRFRRLSKDYEELTANSESMIYTAMIHLMLRRLCPC